MRCLADLVHKFGLLTKVGLHYLRPVYDSWELKVVPRNALPAPSPYGKIGVVGEGEDILDTLERPGIRHRPVNITAAALFDTVASIGRPSDYPSRFRFINSEPCAGIEHMFQALAMHEHRKPFQPVVLQTGDPTNLSQSWFLGYHGDVGGGRKNECLAHLALAWITTKLARFVEFDGTQFWKPHPTPASWALTAEPEGQDGGKNSSILWATEHKMKYERRAERDASFD